jgi:hypothetical protein
MVENWMLLVLIESPIKEDVAEIVLPVMVENWMVLA